MFDLEKTIAEWRKQMLAAGIKTPVPLDELEMHLREEIERQTKSGLSEQEAFHSSAQKIGQGKVLKNEFNKVEDQKLKRVILMIIGWLATGVALWFGVTLLDFQWAFIGFHPECDLETIAAVLIILAAETGIWFLAKASRNRTSRSVSLLICMLLTAIGLFGFLPAEQRHTTYTGNNPIGIVFAEILSRPSPLWFRGGLTLLLCLPCVFWIWRERRRVIQVRSSISP
jgi:hypothetical protein